GRGAGRIPPRRAARHPGPRHRGRRARRGPEGRGAVRRARAPARRARPRPDRPARARAAAHGLRAAGGGAARGVPRRTRARPWCTDRVPGPRWHDAGRPALRRGGVRGLARVPGAALGHGAGRHRARLAPVPRPLRGVGAVVGRRLLRGVVRAGLDLPQAPRSGEAAGVALARPTRVPGRSARRALEQPGGLGAARAAGAAPAGATRWRRGASDRGAVVNVAYVCADFGVPVFGHKGASVHVREMVAAFADGGHDVRVFAPTLDDPGPAGAHAADAATQHARFKTRIGSDGGRVEIAQVAPEGRHVAWLEELKHVEALLGRPTRLRQELRNLLYNQALRAQLGHALLAEPADFIYERYTL